MKNSFLENDPYNTRTEIKNFRVELDWIRQESDKNNVISIIKKVLFMRIILYRTIVESYRYFNSIIYDCLSAINCLQLNKKRYFYFDLRSMIENILRCSLKKGDADETGITELFRQFGELSLPQYIYDQLTSLYANSCDYVHNNIRAELPVAKSFLDIKNDMLSDKQLTSLISDLLKIINIAVEIVIEVYFNEVEYAFYRTNPTIDFLVGTKLAGIYKAKKVASD